MEPQMTIENVPFIWGISFVVNILIGMLTFMLVIRKNVLVWLKGTLTWCGWWSWASALSLIVSVVEGPMSTFSYHQIGIFTETMVNIGLVFWAAAYAFNNWYVMQKDWAVIEKLRAEISLHNKIKAIEDDSKR